MEKDRDRDRLFMLVHEFDRLRNAVEACESEGRTVPPDVHSALENAERLLADLGYTRELLLH